MRGSTVFEHSAAFDHELTVEKVFFFLHGLLADAPRDCVSSNIPINTGPIARIYVFGQRLQLGVTHVSVGVCVGEAERQKEGKVLRKK